MTVSTCSIRLYQQGDAERLHAAIHESVADVSPWLGWCHVRYSLDEAREFGVPLFASATTPQTARGRAVEYATDVVVTLAGVSVTPGDWVIADSTGVVFVTAGDYAVVTKEAQRIAAKEAAMAAAIGGGVPVTEVMGADYEQLLRPEGMRVE